MAAGAAASTVRRFRKPNRETPGSKRRGFPDQFPVPGGMGLMTRPAGPALLQVHMNIMKVPGPIPEIGVLSRSLRHRQRRVMTLETKLIILHTKFRIKPRREPGIQNFVKFRTVRIMTAVTLPRFQGPVFDRVITYHRINIELLAVAPFNPLVMALDTQLGLLFFQTRLSR